MHRLNRFVRSSPLQVPSSHVTHSHSQLFSEPRASNSDIDHAISPIRKWPAEPTKLGEITVWNLLSLLAEGIMVLAPLVFIGFGIAIVTVSGKSTDANLMGQRMEAAAKLGPTIFPLVFAAIVARSLRILGRHVCQRGAKLGTVELLLASRTVGGTVESQLQLRRFTVVGIHLMLLWMLSPLGGQACLRALERTEHVTRNPLALRYLYTGPYAAHLTTKSVNSFDGDLYYALLQAPPKMKAAPHDNWGNVRVPRLEALLTSAAGRRRREEDWLPVTDVETPEQHSSLLGMPVVGLPARNASVVVSFMMYAAYMSLACSSWDTFAESDERLEYYKRISRGGDPLRGGMLGNSSLSPTEHNTTFFLDGDVPGGTLRNASALARDPRPRTVFFVSARRAAEEAEFDMSAIRCVVSETRVEVAVECPESRDCHATRMRRSKPQSPLVDHSTPLDNAALMLNAMTNLPLMYRTDGNASSPVEAFLRNSRKLLMNTYSAPYVNLSEVPPATFAQRLSLVLNAWYQLSLVGYAGVFYGDNPTNLAAYGYDFGQLAATNGSVPQTVVNESCDLMCTRSTQASVTHTVEAFAYSCPWLALLFACSVVMLAMGLAGSVLSVRTSVPDLLGYAASMTYNNRYLPLPNDSGGVLDAMHRARLMYDLPVSVRDVKSFGEVGRIGFTSLANGRPLEKGRRYT